MLKEKNVSISYVHIFFFFFNENVTETSFHKFEKN